MTMNSSLWAAGNAAQNSIAALLICAAVFSFFPTGAHALKCLPTDWSQELTMGLTDDQRVFLLGSLRRIEGNQYEFSGDRKIGTRIERDVKVMITWTKGQAGSFYGDDAEVAREILLSIDTDAAAFPVVNFRSDPCRSNFLFDTGNIRKGFYE